jgi:hypothetical protein
MLPKRRCHEGALEPVLEPSGENSILPCSALHRSALSEVAMPLAKDLLHPLHAEEKRKHKLKRLVQHPNSYFMDVKCPGCYRCYTTVALLNYRLFLSNVSLPLAALVDSRL